MTFTWFISVDDHLIEPARLWQERLPAKWRDTGPRIVRDGDSEFWVYEDRQIVTTGLNAVAGKRHEDVRGHLDHPHALERRVHRERSAAVRRLEVVELGRRVLQHLADDLLVDAGQRPLHDIARARRLRRRAG